MSALTAPQIAPENYGKVDSTVVEELRRIVGAGGVLTSREDLSLYSYDATLPEFQPEVVVFATTAEQVVKIMRLASARQIPIVPRGAGTSLSGGPLPLLGGIALALARMNKIVELDKDNLVATVEPGIVNADFQNALLPMGLMYPPDPASMNVCTLGGNVAMCSGGPRCLKYGVTRDYVLGLEVVLASGEVIHPGGRCVKDVSGYDLTRLFVGSEGTLGVITKITVRLMPQPEGKKTMLAVFDAVEDAGKAVSDIIAHGIVPTTLELMDNLLIQCAEDFTHVGLPRDAEAILLIEVDGAVEPLERQMQQIEAVCRQNRVKEMRRATNPKEVEDLWRARRTVIGAVARLRPSYDLQDITVPRSELPKIIAAIRDISKRYDLPIGVLAHAGDGNLHPLTLFDRRNEDEVRRVHELQREIFQRALELRGTLSGEHGIGLSKRAFLSMQYNPTEIGLFKGLKRLFDPQNILNPHKILEP